MDNLLALLRERAVLQQTSNPALVRVAWSMRKPELDLVEQT